MALALPLPARPGSSREHLRAHRRWQAGQALAQREHWPQAAREFEQASGLHGDRAYALAAAHALIKAGRAGQRRTRARGARGRPSLALAYTLDRMRCSTSAGRDAVDCLQSMPAAGRATTTISSRWRWPCSAATAMRRRSAVLMRWR